VIVLSNNPAPEYLMRSALITKGEKIDHHAPPAAATR
jgi:hypothetical protein